MEKGRREKAEGKKKEKEKEGERKRKRGTLGDEGTMYGRKRDVYATLVPSYTSLFSMYVESSEGKIQKKKMGKRGRTQKRCLKVKERTRHQKNTRKSDFLVFFLKKYKKIRNEK